MTGNLTVLLPGKDSAPKWWYSVQYKIVNIENISLLKILLMEETGFVKSDHEMSMKGSDDVWTDFKKLSANSINFQ